MTLAQWAYVGEIAAAIAVVASLIYVARQLHQNTEISRSGSRQALLTNDQASLQMAVENVDLFEALTKPDKLSFLEHSRFSYIWIVDMRNREHEYLQYKAGVLDEESWQTYRKILLFSLGFERARKWWDSGVKEFFAPSFVEMVDDFIAGYPPVDFVEEFGTWE